jgi:hypothetical protein
VIEVLASLGVGGTVVTAAGVLWLAFQLAEAERRAGDSGAQAERLAGKLAIANATIETERSARKRAEEQADALEAGWQAASATSDPATARELVLARYRASRAATATGGDNQPPVPAQAATPVADGAGDHLLAPGG